jgi:hypothetical protein
MCSVTGVRRRTAVVVAVVAVGVALLSGGVIAAVRSASGGDGETLTPVDLTAEMKKFRAREADRYALLVLRNRGPVPVTVESVRVVSPELRERPPESSGTVLEPGQQLDVPVRFGAVVCEKPLDPETYTRAGRGGLAEATVRVGAEPPRRVRLRLPQPDPYLRTIVSLDCQRQAMEQSVDLRFGGRWVPVGVDALRGDLVMSRRQATGRVVVDSVEGSVVFRVEPSTGAGGAPLLDLPQGTREVRREVTLRLPWCSAHLLIEAKRAYFFPTRAHVDGRYVYTTLTPDPALRAPLSELIEGCVDRLPHS